MKYKLAASLICGDPLKISDEIEELEQARMDFLHFDVMDGHFVPRIGLYPEMLAAIKKKTQIPVDVHLMIEEPERYIPVYAKAGADYLVIHAESKGSLENNLKMVKDHGAKTGVAFKINTDFSAIEHLLPNIDLILIMAIHPGVLGQKMLPSTFDRIESIANKVKNFPNMFIEIDGGVTPETAPEMVRRGANLLVCGTGTIYRPHEGSLSKKINEIRKILTK